MPPRSTIWCAQSDFKAYGTFGANRAPILPQGWYYLQTNRNELPLDQRHQEVPSRVPVKISMPVVHLAQTVHLSCVEINTISKRSETSVHLTNVTWKYHRVWLKSFPFRWYIRRKSYTYLTPRLTLLPIGPKRPSTWPMSPRSTIGCA
jgi:hypothetical protein